MDVVGGAPRSSIVEQSDREIKSDNRREIMREKKNDKTRDMVIHGRSAKRSAGSM